MRTNNKGALLSLNRTIYDIDLITVSAKRNLRNLVLLIVLHIITTVLSILAIVFCGSYLAVFISAVAIVCVSVFLLSKSLTKIKLANYRSTYGEIINIHKDVKIVSTISVGGLGLRTRKYDTYKKDEIRLGVFIEEDETINGYYLNGVSEEHVKYYEGKGKAIHIWGTRFPIRTNIENEKWLCPVCGQFNSNEEKICAGCKTKILK